MKYILLLLTAYLLLFCGCEEAFTKTPLIPAESLSWQGAHETPPESPEENWVYFDTFLKETRIFNGENWETMAVSGIDAVSLKWLGALNTFPELDTNAAFFHAIEKVSYVCDGTTWSILNSNGKDGLGLVWQGKLDAEPQNPQENWYYYDTGKKASYIYSDGIWQQFNADGLNGRPVIWLGSFKNFPNVVEQNAGFYHEVDGITYIMDDLEWKVLSKDGLEGAAGELIIWKGDLDTPPSPALNNWAYYNTVDGKSYIYILETETWATLSEIGKNGEPIHWLGIFDQHPDNLKINNAYRNSEDGNCYIFTGSKWELFSFGGIDGQNGINGINVVWQGRKTEHPDSPEINWAYLNTHENCSFIYTESGWEVLLQNGKPGFEIKLIGSFDYFPLVSTASFGDVFYHKTYKNSYFHNGKKWGVFCQGGAEGTDGRSIIWKGELNSTPGGTPQKDWVYYHKDQGITYIYTGNRWEILLVSATDGKDGKINFIAESDSVSPGDSLVLYHNFSSHNITVEGRYLNEDSMYVEWNTPREWSSYYGISSKVNIYSSYRNYPKRKLLKLRDGRELHAFESYDGGYYGIFENERPAGEVKLFTSMELYDLDVVEKSDGTLLFLYRNWDNNLYLTSISTTGEESTVEISKHTTNSNMVLRSDETAFIVYEKNDGTGFFRTMNGEEISEEHLFCTNYGGGETGVLPLQSGEIIISYPHIDGVVNCIVSLDNSVTTLQPQGSSRVSEVDDMIQLADGSIFLGYKHTTGFQKYTSSQIRIMKLDAQGNSLAEYIVGSRRSSIELTELPNGSLGALDVGYNYTTGYYKGTVHHKGYPHFTILNTNLEETYSIRLIEEIIQPQMIPHDDGSFTVTYIDKFDTYAVKTAQLSKISNDLGIIFKRLSSNHACMINNTGDVLRLQLSARRYD